MGLCQAQHLGGPDTPPWALLACLTSCCGNNCEAFQLLFAMSFAVILKGRHVAALPGGDMSEQQPPRTQALAAASEGAEGAGFFI